MNNKPIYLVVTAFFPTPTCFRGPYVYDQVKAIMKDGRYKVVVMMPHTWMHKDGDYDYDGIHVYRFTSYDLPTNAWPGVADGVNLRSFDKVLKRIGIRYDDIAVAHAHVTANALYANFVKAHNPKARTVLQHHGYDVLSLENGRFANKEWHKRICVDYGKKLCNDIDLHLGVSHEILKYLEAYKGIRIKDKYVLYNGVDTSKFFKLESSLSSSSRPFTIGCVANFWELKDQITLIKAVEILVNEGMQRLKTVFIGTGVTREGCEQYVREHGLVNYFEFNNEVDHRQLNTFYNTLDLFVLPSYWDSFGCVYTEAYACGVPFMTAKGTGVTELIPKSDFDKWVIEPHDYVTLARNIKRVMTCIQTQTLAVEKIQPLNTEIDINTLMKRYLDYIEKK
ncbi:glycosyltransferase family 4 protein [Bacteroides acidifaciens]|uniref:glycosyltransferase family 4 protein n=1 Tax=Bacteroides acidifaciens TaxID=85831 RepID=UPI0025582A36|nr:glycosyltransferase family 4 protein [Bacteroides acidifaciens]